MLTLSSEYWDYYGRLLNLTPMADKRVIYSFHAYGFPQDKFAMGPINEWIGDDGNGGEPFKQERADLHAIIRSALRVARGQ